VVRDLATQLLGALERWQNAHVAVRVVARTDELVALFSGTLGARSGEKGRSLFWPVEPDGAAPATLERPGIYAHPELLSDVRIHVGEFVVEFTQADVTVNVRRLDSSGP
jgi:hypothetical protein